MFPAKLGKVQMTNLRDIGLFWTEFCDCKTGNKTYAKWVSGHLFISFCEICQFLSWNWIFNRFIFNKLRLTLIEVQIYLEKSIHRMILILAFETAVIWPIHQIFSVSKQIALKNWIKFILQTCIIFSIFIISQDWNRMFPLKSF